MTATAEGPPENLSSLVGAELPVAEFLWNSRDVSLYGLAVGACVDGDPRELDLTWGAGGPKWVMPTFGVLAARSHSLRHVALPGFNLRSGTSLHAAHHLEVSPLRVPTSGRVISTGRVLQVTAGRRGAFVVRETVSHLDALTGPVLWTNTVTSYIRGARADVAAEPFVQPRLVAPEFVVAIPGLNQQALIYGLTGDDNPIHGDPASAHDAGFSRPILHGLCTLGQCVRVILRHVSDSSWESLQSVGVRFLSPVLVGEPVTLLASPKEGAWQFEAWTNRHVLSGELSLHQ